MIAPLFVEPDPIKERLEVGGVSVLHVYPCESVNIVSPPVASDCRTPLILFSGSFFSEVVEIDRNTYFAVVGS